MIPKLVKDAMMKQITCVSHISSTTDIWSTDLNSCSLMSLTGHWLSQRFERSCCFACSSIRDGSHKGEAICKMILQMLQLWELGKERIHLVVRGMADAGLPDMGSMSWTHLATCYP